MKNGKKNGSIPVHNILETTNYDLFVYEIPGNRAVNQSHVAKLKNKIKRKSTELRLCLRLRGKLGAEAILGLIPNTVRQKNLVQYISYNVM